MDNEVNEPTALPAVTSPFIDDEEPGTHDYETQREQLLGDGEDDVDDEDGFGEFVYSGVDVQRPEEDQEPAYGDQLAELLGTSADEQPTSSPPLVEAPALPNGGFTHVPPTPVSSPVLP